MSIATGAPDIPITAPHRASRLRRIALHAKPSPARLAPEEPEHKNAPLSQREAQPLWTAVSLTAFREQLPQLFTIAAQHLPHEYGDQQTLARQTPSSECLHLTPRLPTSPLHTPPSPPAKSSAPWSAANHPPGTSTDHGPRGSRPPPCPSPEILRCVPKIISSRC